MSKKQAVGRLAFRVEGDKWTCYIAKPNTMEGAKWVGSVMLGIVDDPVRKLMFMDLMKDAYRDFLQGALGKEVASWDEERAPESERSGSA